MLRNNQPVTHKVLMLVFSISTAHAYAQMFTLENHSLLSSTYLLDIKQDTVLSLKAKLLREGNYETAAGEQINFYNWYTPKVPEIQITWLTQVNHNFGLIWGFSTGETAPKYSIAPSLKLGLSYQNQYKKKHLFTMTALTTIGGELKEKTCIADYGDIGGIHEVNCRLAATTLAPEVTLNYLEYAKPTGSVQVGYKLLF